MLFLIYNIVNIKVVHPSVVINDLCGVVVEGGLCDVRSHLNQKEVTFYQTSGKKGGI